MRNKTALACLALIILGAGYWAAVGDLRSQDAEHTDVPEERDQPRSSLEQGEPFDRATAASFERQLNPAQRDSLVKLTSRFAIADLTCTLPEIPGQVFYVKFIERLSRDLARRLETAGASFVGYAYPNTHFVRARDAEALQAIGDLLKGDHRVVGTLLREPVDKFSPNAWEMLRTSQGGEFLISFWRDTDPDTAAAVLEKAKAEIVVAMTTYDGVPDLIDGGVFVRVSAAGLQTLADSPWVESIQLRPVMATANAGSTALSNASPGQIGPATSYNLTGDNLVVAVFDEGHALQTHLTFSGATAGNPLGTTTGTRVLSMEQNMIGSSHTTHVAGTIIGNGTGHSWGRGYAPGAYALIYRMQWQAPLVPSLLTNRRMARHTHLFVAGNHSYGNIYGGTGGYDAVAQLHDIDCRDLLLQMCTAAHNFGPGDTTMRGDKGLKNALVIGATDNNGAIAGFSSRGPAQDGHLQPQFTAKGQNVTSSIWGSNTNYQSNSGTSMATPGVAGAVTLLTELWQREHDNQFFPPDVSRGLLALTADDRYHPGPDYRYGFGIVDVQAAADVILADKNSSPARRIVRGHARHNSVTEYKIVVGNNAPSFGVTLSWLDIHASTSAGVVLVNDLDLELISPSNVSHHPYSGLTGVGSQTHQFTTNGPNRRDNVELARINQPEPGVWTARVKGFNVPSNPQTGEPNQVVGYVLSSSHDVYHASEKLDAPLNTGSPAPIPDDDFVGVTRNFTVTNGGYVKAVRVYCHITHTRRGDLHLQLRHPDSTTVTLHPVTTNERLDLIGVFPDTKGAQDVTALLNKPAAGTWQVIVSDHSATETGEIRYLALEVDTDAPVNLPDLPPVADAGPDQTVNEGDTVALDGTGSRDHENAPLTFQWTQASGPTVTLQGASTPTPSFTAPQISITEHAVFELTVDNGDSSEATDTDTVTITFNKLPAADAGAAFSVDEGELAQLDGAQSGDPDGGPLTYQWDVSGTAPVTLHQANIARPAFTAHQVNSDTVVTFHLTVDDGFGTDSDTVDVTIIDTTPNFPPMADAGNDFYVDHNATVQLDGSQSSDPDGDPLTFAWTQIGGTAAVTLGGADTPTPSFTAPGADDLLVFELLVEDGNGNLATDGVAVTVNATGAPPSSGSSGGGRDDGGCSTGDQPAWLLALLVLTAGGVLITRQVVSAISLVR